MRPRIPGRRSGGSERDPGHPKPAHGKVYCSNGGSEWETPTGSASIVARWYVALRTTLMRCSALIADEAVSSSAPRSASPPQATSGPGKICAWPFARIGLRTWSGETTCASDAATDLSSKSPRSSRAQRTRSGRGRSSDYASNSRRSDLQGDSNNLSCATIAKRGGTHPHAPPCPSQRAALVRIISGCVSRKTGYVS